MPDTIRTSLGALRRRIRLVVLALGLAWLAIATLAAMGVACLADWQLRLPADVRVVLLVGCAAAAGWALWRHLLRPLATPLGDVDLAIRIERVHPELEERLSSAIQFQQSGVDSGWSGAPALVRATVDQAQAAAAGVRATDVVRAAPLRRVGPVAVGLVVACVVTGLAAPQSTAIALGRLLYPPGDAQWPKRTYLELVEAPKQVAKGESFRFVVGVSKGAVPDKLTVHYEFEDGERASDQITA